MLGSILGSRITDEAMTGRNASNAERWYEARLLRLAAMAVTGVTNLFCNLLDGRSMADRLAQFGDMDLSMPFISGVC